MDLEYKEAAVSGVKVLSNDEGIVEAYVACTGNRDDVGDIIEPGAFTESLKQRTPKGVWGHDWNQPIAKTLEAREERPGSVSLPTELKSAGTGGLYVKMQFNLDTSQGRDAYSNVKFFGDDAQWSIGYRTEESTFDTKVKARRIQQMGVYEYSPVLFGANSLPHTVSVKSALQDLVTELRDVVKESETKSVPGSYEYVRDCVNEALDSYYGDGYSTHAMVTRSDTVIYNLVDTSGDYWDGELFQIKYTLDENTGKVAFSGDPVQVQLVDQVIPDVPDVGDVDPGTPADASTAHDNPAGSPSAMEGMSASDNTEEKAAPNPVDAPSAETPATPPEQQGLSAEDVSLVFRAVLAVDQDEQARQFALTDENLGAANDAIGQMVTDAGTGTDQQPDAAAPPAAAAAPPTKEAKLVDIAEIMEFETISAQYLQNAC